MCGEGCDVYFLALLFYFVLFFVRLVRVRLFSSGLLQSVWLGIY